MGNNVFTVISFFYSFMLNIIYFSKKRLRTIETKLFGYILGTNFINIIVALLSYSIENINGNQTLNIVFAKCVIICFYTFSFLFNLYVILISRKNDKMFKNKNNKKILVLYLLLLIPILVLPIYYHHEENIIYSYGPCANYEYGIISIMIIYWVFLIVKNYQAIKRKKYIPIISFIVLLVFVAIIQKVNPQLLLLTSLETFITFLMYFTIENPDVKMLNEMFKNKELMEQNYEDKYNFLFEITGEARNPLVNISRVCNELKEEKLSDSAESKVNTLSSLVRQLDFSINNILNISSLDVQKLKIVNSKYDLEKLCNDLKIRIEKELKHGVDFNITLPKQMPVLYGDYMKLRQMIYSLLVNACKNTVSGNITLKVNLIEKYDVARIIFNISDTGCGMSIEKINEILGSTGELDKEELDNLEKKEVNVKVCQKVAKIMGGNLLIKSRQDEGTEVILTIDQRVYHEKDTSVLTKYEEEISNYRKVLIVAQDKNAINVLKKKLSNKNITCSVLYYGALGIDKIMSGKKYDYIIVEDEMKEMSGFMTFKGMNEVKGFNIPTIIMLKEDKEHIKEHFIKDGFSDTIILNNLENDLERIMEKY